MATIPKIPSTEAGKTPLPQVDLDPAGTDNIDQVLNRADALISRHQTAPPRAERPSPPAGAAPEPVSEFPVLTEVVPAPRKPPTQQDLMLDQIEDELRLELLSQLSTELERSIEVSVHTRLDANIEAIMNRTRDRLVTEVRRAVREALDEVIGQEIERLKKQTGKTD